MGSSSDFKKEPKQSLVEKKKEVTYLDLRIIVVLLEFTISVIGEAVSSHTRVELHGSNLLPYQKSPDIGLGLDDEGKLLGRKLLPELVRIECFDIAAFINCGAGTTGTHL